MIGECLQNIPKLGGQVVSVTTYGFITNLEDLENKLIILAQDDIVLLNKYRSLRLDLSYKVKALELKYQGKGYLAERREVN